MPLVGTKTVPQIGVQTMKTASKKSNQTPAKKPLTIKGVGKGKQMWSTPKNLKLPCSGDAKENMALLSQVYVARQDGMSFNDLEIKFGLRRANGMTSYRLVKQYEKLSKQK